MTGSPPVHRAEQPGPSRAGSLGFVCALVLVASAACAGPAPTGSRPSERNVVITPDPTGAVEHGDIDGLVVLTGGGLSIGTPGGALVGVDGPGGAVSALSARNGRLAVQTAEGALAVADSRPDGVPLVWRRVEMSAPIAGRGVSGPAISPRGDLVAFTADDPGTAGSFEVVTIDVSTGDRRSHSVDREANGPPVWIDDDSLLVEVLPTPGGTRFLRLAVAAARTDPVRANGFGPALSGDGSVLAIASNDGSVLVHRTSDWLAGHKPNDGVVVEASGRPFTLALDGTGERIAIGYADDGGDPASIAVFVNEGGRWRRSPTPVRIAAGTVTMIGWLN